MVGYCLYFFDNMLYIAFFSKIFPPNFMPSKEKHFHFWMVTWAFQRKKEWGRKVYTRWTILEDSGKDYSQKIYFFFWNLIFYFWGTLTHFEIWSDFAYTHLLFLNYFPFYKLFLNPYTSFWIKVPWWQYY